MAIEISKIDKEANKRYRGETTRFSYYSKETIVFLLNYENQLKNSNPALEYIYILITVPVSFRSTSSSRIE